MPKRAGAVQQEGETSGRTGRIASARPSDYTRPPRRSDDAHSSRLPGSAEETSRPDADHDVRRGPQRGVRPLPRARGGRWLPFHVARSPCPRSVCHRDSTRRPARRAARQRPLRLLRRRAAAVPGGEVRSDLHLPPARAPAGSAGRSRRHAPDARRGRRDGAPRAESAVENPRSRFVLPEPSRSRARGLHRARPSGTRAKRHAQHGQGRACRLVATIVLAIGSRSLLEQRRRASPLRDPTLDCGIRAREARRGTHPPPLPAPFPYRFGLERTRRALESLGASSTVGFVLAHAGRRPAAADVFGADSLSWSLA